MFSVGLRGRRRSRLDRQRVGARVQAGLDGEFVDDRKLTPEAQAQLRRFHLDKLISGDLLLYPDLGVGGGVKPSFRLMSLLLEH
jgi:hypothetical protein